ncbi:hypothetical protein DSO57_1014053 [Entomophthora muscae]|uniref:Uncharacterized protein n=1 Tax=Entomophthora muscae TaxID=34485 RepID=A0ACC2SUQ9_9FUNG|nr:hypothetical protein DSO57_1014053 [Entomophthora muscae]
MLSLNPSPTGSSMDRDSTSPPSSTAGSDYSDNRPTVSIGPVEDNEFSSRKPFGDGTFSSFYSAQKEGSRVRFDPNTSCRRFPSEYSKEFEKTKPKPEVPATSEGKRVYRPLFNTTIPGVASPVEVTKPKEEPKPNPTYSPLEIKLITAVNFSTLFFAFFLAIQNLLPSGFLKLYFVLLVFLSLVTYILLRFKEHPWVKYLTSAPAPKAQENAPSAPRSLLADLGTEGLTPLNASGVGKKVQSPIRKWNRSYNLDVPNGVTDNLDRTISDTSYKRIFEPNEEDQDVPQDSGLLGLLGNVKTYLTAPFEAPKAHKAVSGEFSGLLCFTAEQTLQMISEAGSSQNAAYATRLWIANKILASISSSTRKVDAALKEMKLPFLSIENPAYLDDHSQAAGAKQGTAPRNLMELYASNPQSDIVASRLRLERYINIPLYQSRSYIVQRIKELGEHGFLSAFSWKGGSEGKWNYSVGNFSLPTDAELVSHLFVTFMDLTYGVNSTRFSDNHFNERGASISGIKGLGIKQVSSRPPHYVVIGGGKVFELPEGENNIFMAIYVFVFFVMRDHSGYISGIPLHSPGIGLDSLIH